MIETIETSEIIETIEMIETIETIEIIESGLSPSPGPSQRFPQKTYGGHTREGRFVVIPLFEVLQFGSGEMPAKLW